MEHQRGLTLIELMISIVVGAILMGFVLSIHTNMTVAYHGQSSISDLEQNVQSARQLITRELMKAGHRIPDGFRTAALGAPSEVVASLQIINNRDGTGPDSVRLFYADAGVTARVVPPMGAEASTVDDASRFRAGDLAVFVNPSMAASPVAGGGNIATFLACVVEITAVAPTELSYATRAPYNVAGNTQCEDVLTADADGQTLVYRFVARSFRIDPTRPDSAVLQASTSGELVADDWQDVGVGFTTMQFATRYIEDSDGIDLDGDGDPTRDWYSGEAQETPDSTGTRPANAVPAQVTISVEARSRAEMPGAGSASTRELQDATNVPNNEFGDWAGMTLPSETPPYNGNFAFRYSTGRVDLRNLGVGR